jgi:hypothetical protein
MVISARRWRKFIAASRHARTVIAAGAAIADTHRLQPIRPTPCRVRISAVPSGNAIALLIYPVPYLPTTGPAIRPRQDFNARQDLNDRVPGAP